MIAAFAGDWGYGDRPEAVTTPCTLKAPPPFEQLLTPPVLSFLGLDFCAQTTSTPPTLRSPALIFLWNF